MKQEQARKIHEIITDQSNWCTEGLPKPCDCRFREMLPKLTLKNARFRLNTGKP